MTVEPMSLEQFAAGVESKWTLDLARLIIKDIEAFSPSYGCHVGLTGGVLYKDGPRKDLDLVFYRIRQVLDIDRCGLLNRLREYGFDLGQDYGFVHKSQLLGRSVDLLFPEVTSGDHYPFEAI